MCNVVRQLVSKDNSGLDAEENRSFQINTQHKTKVVKLIFFFFLEIRGRENLTEAFDSPSIHFSFFSSGKPILTSTQPTGSQVTRF